MSLSFKLRVLNTFTPSVTTGHTVGRPCKQYWVFCYHLSGCAHWPVPLMISTPETKIISRFSVIPEFSVCLLYSTNYKVGQIQVNFGCANSSTETRKAVFLTSHPSPHNLSLRVSQTQPYYARLTSPHWSVLRWAKKCTSPPPRLTKLNWIDRMATTRPTCKRLVCTGRTNTFFHRRLFMLSSLIRLSPACTQII